MAIIILPNIPSYDKALAEAKKAQDYYSAHGFSFIPALNGFSTRDKTEFRKYAKMQICTDISVQVEISIKQTEKKQFMLLPTSAVTRKV